jgi:hypothetical protein
MFGTEKNEEY